MHTKPIILSAALFGVMIFHTAFAGAPAQSAAVESLHLDWRDTTVNPSDDFYRYANGTWQKNHPIPDAYSRWGSFNLVQNQVEDQVHQLLLDAASDKNANKDSLTAKIGNFYASGMDMNTINQAGIAPLKPVLNTIKAIQSRADVQANIATLQKMGVNAAFSFSSMQDFKNSQRMIAVAYQGGLGLPDRDYYLHTDATFKAIRKAYAQHITNMFVLLGDTPARAATKANTVMALETALAKASMTQIAQRNPHAIYHMMDMNQLATRYPHFAWARYVALMGKPGLKHINIAMPDYFKAMDALYAETPLQDWKNYLTWRVLDDYAPYLSTPFVDEHFHMVSVLTGQKHMKPRWKQVLNTEDALLGFAVGQLYVKRYFPESSKKAMTTMLNNIREALAHDLKQLAWMTPKTRERALEKLQKMGARVGYPEQWRDYSDLHIDRGPYVLNVARANAFLVRLDLNKINKPVDPFEWAMPPQTVNAYYDPSMNRINLPAGILQPPFFDPNAPEAVNYGAIGFVIGHEITHGFDDQGAKFDSDGNLKNWWLPSDLKQFQNATHCISNQFSTYEVADGLKVKGPLVVGEATADLGGLILAHRAFVRSKGYATAPTLSHVTPEKQFFLSTAHVWAMNIRPEQARLAVTTDPHPPARYRVNGTMVNMPAFQKAYGVTAQSTMHQAKPCHIW